MFVKKLVEKATKKPGGNTTVLKSEDVDPRLVFHYGIPSGSAFLAYDTIQQILAISTKDGRIKLYGKDYTQAILESTEAVSSKFVTFVENQGALININSQNHIEVWDINEKLLSHVYTSEEEITSFALLHQSLYIYIGDSVGNVSVLKLEKEPWTILRMKYTIPLSASHGNAGEAGNGVPVMQILPQPTAESKRVLIIYRDGFITLWDIQESKVIFTTGGTMSSVVSHETKQVTAACWVCHYGSKVAVGYSNGEIFIWSIPSAKIELVQDKDLCATQSAPLCKLNLGYKLDKIPLAALKWAYADGKASRLYTLGMSDAVSANLSQVVLLNEHTESRTIKLGIHLPEPCVDMEVISRSNEQRKHDQDVFLLLGKSGHIYAYDDHAIEKYLLQCQSRSPPSLPRDVLVKLPFSDSSITVAKFITDHPHSLCSGDEGNALLAKFSPPLFPFDMRQKDATHSAQFSGFSKIKHLYITGHSNGAINFWDASSPILLPVISVLQQSEDDFSLSGVPLTALYFDTDKHVLISGDQIGTVRIFRLKPEAFTGVSSFMSLQGISKKGSNHIVQSLKIVKVNGAVLSFEVNCNSKYLAVGSDLGYVSLLDMEGPTTIYEKHISSELCTGVISLQFVTCSLHGFDKNVLAVATKDSSVLAIESDSGNTLGSGLVRPKKPSRALFMQIFDGQDTIGKGPSKLEGKSADSPMSKQLSVLLCSEKAAYVYSLVHVVQGIKKVLYKKKFQSCCWASTFSTHDTAGVILLFSNGKVEIRSLPELSLLKETSIRGFTMSAPKLNSLAESVVSSSSDGELIMVKGDQEMFIVSILHQKNIYRQLEHVSQVYKEGLTAASVLSAPVIHKEKKKGIFSSVMKDMTGSKPKHVTEEQTEGSRGSTEELSAIFSVENFPSYAESRGNMNVDEKEAELDIDDIDLGDFEDKPKGHSMMGALNKQNFSSKFQAIKGKLKEMKGKNERVPAKEEPQDEKAGTVDDIKRKYGFTLSGDSSSAAKMAQSKLSENLKKLQGISIRTTEMQETAKSFSSLAKEVLRIAEHDKRAP